MKHYIKIDEFNRSECDEARKQAAYDFLSKERKMDIRYIDIHNTKLAPSDKATILWIQTDEKNIKNIRYKSSIIQNRNINLVTFIPAALWNRKQQLINNCKQ